MADGSTTPNPMVDQSPQGDESMMMEDHVSETSHHGEEEEEEEEVEEDDSNNDDHDFFDHEPSKVEKMEMRKASKRPSEWLKLLCKEWALHNMQVVEATDKLFSDYKPYLKGYLSSQLLCRLSIPPLITKHGANGDTSPPLPMVDFWGILQITDEFDKAYIVAQIERFSALYQIHATTILQDDAPSPDHHHQQHHQLLHQQHHQQHQQHHHHHNNNATIDLPYDDHAAAVAAAAAAQANGSLQLPSYMTEAAAVAVAVSNDVQKLTKKQASEVTKAHRMAKDAEKALELERRQNMKREQKRISLERKEQKAREREAAQMKKAQERMARENSREARRKRKLDLRLEREKFAQEQKEAALKRAAELVSSNRVPIEITRGAAAAKAAANAAMMQQSGSVNHHHHHHHNQVPEMEHHQHHHHVAPTSASAASPTSQPRKRRRSAIVVSTAADLHQIVTHSKNLWAKYNAIAKEHNQKVNWITVAKELGIHVKVREKYARMHSRAEQRGFDWEVNGQMKIKDHPEIFLEPTQAEQKAKMPPPPPDAATTVLINEDTQKEVIRTDEAAVAAAAAVVDATVDAGATAAAVAASLAADPAHLTDNKAVRI
ncbi:unnamed protein product [Cylindrotheca closterium]|uniref:Uncharacterized protein n=1 Tax=Cylindrotheca closterium TaxID=2856 RepID=A0AAD2CJF6_9STRA|nr:unnamed protein product [Cylindrotheca closterium]